MGFGFPAAMGIKMNFPNDMVVCATGEGSIQMNIQELSTCLQYGIPVKIFCLNNGSLGMVRQWQDMNYEGRHSHSYMESLPDFSKLVEAYGHVGVKALNRKELDTALADALVNIAIAWFSWMFALMKLNTFILCKCPWGLCGICG